MKSGNLPHTAPRTGFGYDVHRFAAGRSLVLGGVQIPHSAGLDGHSDADVLTHAIMDALLGAAALGDIGQHFPNTDPQFKDIASITLLRRVGVLLHEHGYKLVNVDSMLVIEEPKISPFVLPMRQNIADALGIDLSSVSVKVTTNERLGSLGRSEGAAAYALAVII